MPVARNRGAQQTQKHNKTMETNIRQTLLTMKVKEKATFPVRRLGTIRTTCSNLSMTTEKRFTTKTSRTDKTITVTRIE